MTIRQRYYLAILPLFAGLGAANALLLFLLARYEVSWGVGEQARGAALAIAAFANPSAPAGPVSPAQLATALTRIDHNLGGLSALWFDDTKTGWSPRSLATSPGLLPPAPTAAIAQRLRDGSPVVLHLPHPDAPFDEAIGYAGVFTTQNTLAAIVAASTPDTTQRIERARSLRTGATFLAFVLLAGLLMAEILTRLARREIDRLAGIADALSNGNYSTDWHTGRIRELNDLGGTLRTMASILGEGVQQTRRKFFQTDLLPSDHDLAEIWQHVCEDAPAIRTPDAHLVLLRLGRTSYDDFLGVRETPHGWFAVAGRLDAPSSPSGIVERILRATTARDYFLGSAPSLSRGASRPSLFPCRHLDLFSFPRDGTPPSLVTFTAAATTATSSFDPTHAATPRTVAGTLSPESQTFATGYLLQFPRHDLASIADELAGILSSRDPGILALFEFQRQPTTPTS